MIMATKYNSIIYNFKAQQFESDWHVVNDGVMGGLSKGEKSINDAGNGLFKGAVSIQNNGGFTSIKHSFSKKSVSQFKVIKLALKGDGKPYQFRIKSNLKQHYSYIQEFETSGQWETITIPFDAFYSSFRGNKLNQTNYDGKFIEEVAFLIGNKRKESFALEIESIWLE